MGLLATKIDVNLRNDLKARLDGHRTALAQARINIEIYENNARQALDAINDIKALAYKYQIEL